MNVPPDVSQQTNSQKFEGEDLARQTLAFVL
jgi:hypothetical protein